VHNPAVLALVLLVVSIGLTDSLNPTTVAPALFLATERHGAATRIASFTLGVFAVSLVGGLLVVIGPGQLLLHALPHPGPRAKHIAELVGGAGLLALAVALWLGRHHVTRRISSSTKGGRGIGATFLLGAGIMAVELPTAFPYFAAIAAIVASDVALSAQILLLVLFNVAFVVPLLAILAIRVVAGERASRTLERLGGWLRRQAASFVAVLLGLLGAVAVAIGLVGLV
jgi:cytochrome c biogenesis protein CcdA